MGTRVTQDSFTRGELSPRLGARTSLEQYAIGLKSAKNAIIHQEGGISNRMGLEFCGIAKYSNKITRTMKFVFNSEQTYMLEFGDKYIRFLKDGGYIVYPDNYENEDLRGKIVEIESPYAAADLPYIKRTQAGDLLTLTHINYPSYNLSRYSHYDWKLEEIVFTPSIAAPKNVTAAWTGKTDGNTRKYQYVVTAVNNDNNEESERSSVVEITGHREANWLSGEYATINWTAVEGASEYNIYRSVNGIFGYLGTAEGTSFTDDNIEPDLSSSAPVKKNPFENNNYPSCSCYYQQRKMYANSNSNPQTLWSSQLGAINNFNTSRPLIATDAVTLNMDDREVNEIRHLVPTKDLIVLTSNSEWKVNGTDGIFQANPTPAAVIQSCYGASHVEPVVSGEMIIFVQAGGSVIRDLGYEYVSDSYNGEELSIFSNHLFEGKEVRCMAYAKEPYRLLFVVFTDGTCAAMTYNKKQKLCGWTRVETEGKFEWVDVVREGLEDVAYFVIERERQTTDENGKLVWEKVKYIERTKTRIINDTKDAFLVDCGLSAKFTEPIKKILGLDHLEGKKVIANVNGGIIQNLTVKNGAIDLPEYAYSIIVGLPYSFELETLNIEGENTQGLKKIINCVSAKVHKSREDFCFVGANDFESEVSRSDESINNSGLLFSKDIPSTVFAEPTTDATVKIRQDKPLPLTILSISATIDVQDNENN